MLCYCVYYRYTQVQTGLTHLLVLSLGKMYESSAPALLSIVAFGTYMWTRRVISDTLQRASLTITMW